MHFSVALHVGTPGRAWPRLSTALALVPQWVDYRSAGTVGDTRPRPQVISVKIITETTDDAKVCLADTAHSTTRTRQVVVLIIFNGSGRTCK